MDIIGEAAKQTGVTREEILRLVPERSPLTGTALTHLEVTFERDAHGAVERIYLRPTYERPKMISFEVTYPPETQAALADVLK